uniref:Interleukin-17 receptor A-like n=1 Tax=Gouania willdenowi TaxID=441366 RepID=A0A8C5E4M2_GOUWI
LSLLFFNFCIFLYNFLFVCVCVCVCVCVGNCFDSDWSAVSDYTPSAPEGLRVGFDIRRDESGALQPVLTANWTIKDDGESLQWNFSANMLILDPGHQYRVSVFNIPKPQLEHSSYDISSELSVPGCDHSDMKMTQFCSDTGSLWIPNISVSTADSFLNVSFSSDSQCEKYLLIISCSSHTHTKVNVLFNLSYWPRWCCLFHVEIKPLFQRCSNDCRRVNMFQDVCPESPSAPAPYTLVICCGVSLYVPGKALAFSSQQKAPLLQVEQVTRRPKVLLIYSHDHRLYRDVVLCFCAFLQDRCGAEVLVDLLDTGSLGQVGGARWLQMQRRRLQPGDKVLLLCSKGVQAKWRALCGEAQVTLREDELSDDILTAFLNLFLPSMHRPGALGMYVVAYFEELSDESDVPSLFHISVKYALMKDVEEMLFRILDIHKYEPGRVRHVHGVHVHDYFTCPSGRALRVAIEAFQDHQRQHPDWFQKECELGEEELDQHAHTHAAPVLQCVPVIRAGLPAFRSEVNIHPEGCSAHIHTQRPLLSQADTMSPLLEGRSQEQDSTPRGESDQGYVSKSSSQPLLDLVRLQEALFEQSLRAPQLNDETVEESIILF